MPFTATEARALVTAAEVAQAEFQAAAIAALATKTTRTLETITLKGGKKVLYDPLPTLINNTESSIKSLATKGIRIYNLYSAPQLIYEFRIYFESQGYTVTAITGNNVNNTFFNPGVGTQDNIRVTW